MIWLLSSLAWGGSPLAEGALAIGAPGVAVGVQDQVQIWSPAGELRDVWPTGSATFLAWEAEKLWVSGSVVDQWADGQLLARHSESPMRGTVQRAVPGGLIGGDTHLEAIDATTGRARAVDLRQGLWDASASTLLLMDGTFLYGAGARGRLPDGYTDCLLVPDGGSVVCRVAGKGCALARLSLPDGAVLGQMPGCGVLNTSTDAVLVREERAVVYLGLDGAPRGRAELRPTEVNATALGSGGAAVRAGNRLIWLGDDGATWTRDLKTEPVTGRTLPPAPTLVVMDRAVARGLDPATGAPRWALDGRDQAFHQDGDAIQGRSLRIDASGWRGAPAPKELPLAVNAGAGGLVVASRGDQTLWTAASRRLIGRQGGLALVRTTAGPTRVEALREETGRVAWKREIGADDVVIAELGLLRVERRGAPTEVWSAATGATLLSLPDGAGALPAGKEGLVRYAQGEGSVLIDTASGQRLELAKGDEVLVRRADGGLLIRTDLRGYGAVELWREGRRLWRQPIAGGNVFAAEAGGMILLSVGQLLLALDPATGALRWSAPLFSGGGLQAWLVSP